MVAASSYWIIVRIFVYSSKFAVNGFVGFWVVVVDIILGENLIEVSFRAIPMGNILFSFIKCQLNYILFHFPYLRDFDVIYFFFHFLIHSLIYSKNTLTSLQLIKIFKIPSS